MMELAVSVLAAAVVGSVHCTSMCGGLAAFGAAAASRTERVGASVAYQAARGAGYIVLGAVAGAFGSTLDDAGARIGAGRIAGAVAGASMVAWGLYRLWRLAFPPSLVPRQVALVPPSRLVRSLRGKSPVVRSALIGGCTAALPCGFLHASLAFAASTGGAPAGATVMAAFWLGTLPALAAFGAAAALLTAPLKRHASAIGALVLVAFGLTSLLGRWAPSSVLHPFEPYPSHTAPSAVSD